MQRRVSGARAAFLPPTTKHFLLRSLQLSEAAPIKAINQPRSLAFNSTPAAPCKTLIAEFPTLLSISTSSHSARPPAAAQPFAVTMADYNSMKVPELKKLLTERGLPHTGNKADLIARLNENDKQKAAEGAEPQAGKLPSLASGRDATGERGVAPPAHRIALVAVSISLVASRGF